MLVSDPTVAGRWDVEAIDHLGVPAHFRPGSSRLAAPSTRTTDLATEGAPRGMVCHQRPSLENPCLKGLLGHRIGCCSGT